MAAQPRLRRGSTRTGHTFAGWYSDPGLISAFSFSTPITADRTLYAKWTINNYLLSVTRVGDGLVTSAPAGIDCGAACGTNYDYNTVVTLTATPATGIHVHGLDRRVHGHGQLRGDDGRGEGRDGDIHGRRRRPGRPGSRPERWQQAVQGLGVRDHLERERRHCRTRLVQRAVLDQQRHIVQGCSGVHGVWAPRFASARGRSRSPRRRAGSASSRPMRRRERGLTPPKPPLAWSRGTHRCPSGARTTTRRW